MSKLKDAVRNEHEKTLRDQIDTYERLTEVCKRTIEREQLQIQNYQAKLEVLRESLKASQQARSEKA
jgi:hypothetical protein